MSIREPDLEGWNTYDPKKIPEEKRRLILRTLPDSGVPMYYILTILRQNDGYCFTDFGSTFWKRFEKDGTHWAWLDELKVEKSTSNGRITEASNFKK